MPGVRLRSLGSAHGQAVPPQLPVDLQLATTLPACSVLHHDVCVFAADPCHYTGTVNCPAVECVHTIGSGHHCWLLWSPAAGSEDTTEDFKGLCSLCRAHSAHRRSCGCQFRGPQWPEPKRHHSPQTWSHHAPHIRARVTACFRVFLPVGQGLFLLKSLHKLWKRWLLLQMHRRLCKATGIMKNQGNMTPSKKHSKMPVTDPKKWSYRNRSTTNVK